MPRRYRRHERFDARIAARPDLQIVSEEEARLAREFIQDCLDLVEGRKTPGAARAEAERSRLLKLANEAKKRALCGADPLNMTKHSKGRKPKQKLAADPIEHVGSITRVLSSISRLTGKNKLDQRQVIAADMYRDAYERMHKCLGGSMDLERVRSGGASHSGPAEAISIASEKLKKARDLLGARAIIILEQIVCHGMTVEECTRLTYGYQDGQTATARDINFVGRILRESLTELGKLWLPVSRRSPTQSFRTSKHEALVQEDGGDVITVAPYISQ